MALQMSLFSAQALLSFAALIFSPLDPNAGLLEMDLLFTEWW